MNSQTKKIQKSAQQKKSAVKKEAAKAEPSSFQKNLPFIITGFYFLLSIIGILNHEMWRDELQAWMVAIDAHSIAQLFQNVKYEGHPALWHLFLQMH